MIQLAISYAFEFYQTYIPFVVVPRVKIDIPNIPWMSPKKLTETLSKSLEMKVSVFQIVVKFRLDVSME